MFANTQPFSEVSRLTLPGGMPLSRSLVESVIARHEQRAAGRMATLWAYFRNTMSGASPVGTECGRHYRLAQERGLPRRVLGKWDARSHGARRLADDRASDRKEIVVENDIAWRIQTMVDFMFGRPISIASTAADPGVRRTIEQVLEAVWQSSGGIAFLQDMGLMGHVYGHVDLLVRAQSAEAQAPAVFDTPTDSPQEPTPRGTSLGGAGDLASLLDRATTTVRIELIEPPRGVALPGESDYRDIDAYILRSRRESRDPDVHTRPAPFASALSRWWRSGQDSRTSFAPEPQAAITTTEVFAGSLRQVYEQADGGRVRLIHEGSALVTPSDGDRPPIVHIQNISQPFEYEGIGEVEPLIPLQDELNTRLSDRASRVTMQSFKMYLARGLDGAGAMPIAPGVIWSTDNLNAQITAFGGDASSPSEDRHIDEIREAMDKTSAVPPVAGGVVQAKIGNLSSENALRITLLGLVSKTNRKRITYGRGIVQASRLVLEALDRLDILKTSPAERGLRIDWVDPIPHDEQLALLAAQKKVDLGVPREQVLSELGYEQAARS